MGPCEEDALIRGYAASRQISAEKGKRPRSMCAQMFSEKPEENGPLNKNQRQILSLQREILCSRMKNWFSGRLKWGPR